MKKISFVLLTFLVIFGTGCLKDKGFDNQEYGINNPGSTAAGVGFNGAYTRGIGLDVTGDAQLLDATFSTIGYYAATPPSSDMHLTIATDPTLVDDYNTANGTSIVVLDPSAYTLDENFVLPAGSQYATLPISINSTLELDLNTTYAIGLRIIDVDNGAQVASNMGKRLLIFNIKNRYDGAYELTFSNYHPVYNPDYEGSVAEVEMWTTGPNTVKIYWPDLGGFYNPALLGGDLTAFGSQEPEYTIDANNKVTVQNSFAGATTFYNMNSSFDSHYDPITKTIYAKFGYNNPGGVFVPGTSREWTQEFRYIGPR